MTMDLVNQLGPAVQVNVKLRMPAAFLEYIQEVAREDLDNFCSHEIVRAMITHLDGDKSIRLDRYTIPKAIAYRDKEILEHYLGSV
jgi:predicted Ser/Thr protein kinase